MRDECTRAVPTCKPERGSQSSGRIVTFLQISSEIQFFIRAVSRMQATATSDPDLSRIEAALTRGKQSAEGRIRLAIFSASMQQVSSSGTTPSLASVSAAIISGLEGPSLNDAATVSAMFFLLATLLPSLSDAVLRLHADAVSRRVTQALSKHADSVPVLRWACPVLARLLLCQVSP